MTKLQRESRRKFIKLASAGTSMAFMPTSFRHQALRFLTVSNADKFLAACASGELETVKKLLAANTKLINVKDSIGRSGFALARLAGHLDISEFLRTSGYQPDLHETVLDLDWEGYEKMIGEETEKTRNIVNSDHPIGGSLMWAAAAGGAGSDLWRIYSCCGDPNLNTKKELGTTPLQKALLFPDLKVAELTAAALLSNDADPNPDQNKELPPLHISAKRGSIEMVEMLVRLGADLGTVDHNGYTASQLAEKYGHEKVANLLNNHTQIARVCRTSRLAFDKDGNAYNPVPFDDIPLYVKGRFVGQSHRNFDEVEKGLKTDPRMAHSIATTSEICVEAGAHMGNKKIVELLINHGAPYSLPTAVMMNDFTTVTRLLDQDPNRINERGAHDFALLWYPIIGKCDIDMMQLLLDRGATVESQHFLGATALHWACQRSCFDQVELLVENGADVNRISRKFSPIGETPLQMTKDEKIIDFLKSRGAK